MVVLISNARLTAHVRSHEWTRDARGVPMPSAADTVTARGPYPGNATEAPDRSWELRLDPRCWPLRAGDEVTDTTGQRWVLDTDPRLHAIPGYPAADYIEATGTLDPPRTP